MNQTIFEEIKKINEYGQEFWSSRELGRVLEYSRYQFFLPVIEKAKIACKKAGYDIADHMQDILHMVPVGSGAMRRTSDITMSRYMCYLVVQNADPSKKIVALAQTYFAVQTRRQEVTDSLEEDRKRVAFRGEITERNKILSSTAQSAGVTNFGNFHDAGYMGLYGGLRQKQIKKIKKIHEDKNILDHMGSEELAANIFRVSQTNAKIKREGIMGQEKASSTHHEVGKKVRKTIKDLGGTMPERLPVTDHVKNSKKRLKASR